MKRTDWLIVAVLFVMGLMCMSVSAATQNLH